MVRGVRSGALARELHMSVKLPCGCKDVTMCAQHEAEWWVRHREALARHAAEQVPLIKQVEPDNLDLVGG